jgi:hypothetical protein
MALTQESAFRKDQTMPSGNKMEHRHFAVVAGILSAARPAGLNMQKAQWAYWQHMARTFADELAHTNPRFDRQRFLRACGYDPM